MLGWLIRINRIRVIIITIAALAGAMVATFGATISWPWAWSFIERPSATRWAGFTEVHGRRMGLRWPLGHVGSRVRGPRPRIVATSRRIPRIDTSRPMLRRQHWHCVERGGPRATGYGRHARIGVVDRVRHDLKPRCLLNQTIREKVLGFLEVLTVLSTAKAQVLNWAVGKNQLSKVLSPQALNCNSRLGSCLFTNFDRTLNDFFLKSHGIYFYPCKLTVIWTRNLYFFREFFECFVGRKLLAVVF
jgi:hypothetical protein